MYSMGKDTYTCDICGFEGKWDVHDDHRGDLWECEHCGTHFCTKCFVEKLGQECFNKMLRDADKVLCADCYGKGVFGDD